MIARARVHTRLHGGKFINDFRELTQMGELDFYAI